LLRRQPLPEAPAARPAIPPRNLAQQSGLAAVCADIYDARQAVAGDFDIAYTI
jgi:hypothetical protein